VAILVAALVSLTLGAFGAADPGAALGRRIYALEGGPTPGFAFSNGIEFLDVPRSVLRR